jgi:hypothetical protein
VVSVTPAKPTPFEKDLGDLKKRIDDLLAFKAKEEEGAIKEWASRRDPYSQWDFTVIRFVDPSLPQAYKSLTGNLADLATKASAIWQSVKKSPSMEKIQTANGELDELLEKISEQRQSLFELRQIPRSERPPAPLVRPPKIPPIVVSPPPPPPVPVPSFQKEEVEKIKERLESLRSSRVEAQSDIDQWGKRLDPYAQWDLSLITFLTPEAPRIYRDVVTNLQKFDRLVGEVDASLKRYPLTLETIQSATGTVDELEKLVKTINVDITKLSTFGTRGRPAAPAPAPIARPPTVEVSPEQRAAVTKAIQEYKRFENDADKKIEEVGERRERDEDMPADISYTYYRLTKNLSKFKERVDTLGRLALTPENIADVESQVERLRLRRSDLEIDLEMLSDRTPRRLPGDYGHEEINAIKSLDIEADPPTDPAVLRRRFTDLGRVLRTVNPAKTPAEYEKVREDRQLYDFIPYARRVAFELDKTPT